MSSWVQNVTKQVLGFTVLSLVLLTASWAHDVVLVRTSVLNPKALPDDFIGRRQKLLVLPVVQEGFFFHGESLVGGLQTYITNPFLSYTTDLEHIRSKLPATRYATEVPVSPSEKVGKIFSLLRIFFVTENGYAFQISRGSPSMLAPISWHWNYPMSQAWMSQEWKNGLLNLLDGGNRPADLNSQRFFDDTNVDETVALHLSDTEALISFLESVPVVQPNGTFSRWQTPPAGLSLKGQMGGFEYTAFLLGNGTISYEGKIFDSPDLACEAAIEQTCNGWMFWQYLLNNGKWVPLTNLKDWLDARINSPSQPTK